MAKKSKKASEVEVKNNYEQINDFDGIITEVMQVRDYGCIVRERNTKTGHVSSIFVPGVKKKSKGDYKRLIKDMTPEQKEIKAQKRKEAKAKKAAGGEKPAKKAKK